MNREKIKEKNAGTGFLQGAAFLLSAFAIALFLLARGTVTAGAKTGLSLCGRIIIPAVFPFMFLCKLMVKIRVAETLPQGLRRVISRAFRVGDEGCAIIFLSLFAGYPVCTVLCGDLCRAGRMDREEAGRLIAFSNNATPAFLMGLGGAVLGSAAKGIALYISVISAALFYGFFLGRRAPRIKATKPLPEYKLSFGEFIRHFCDALTESALSVVALCGYIVLFSAVAACIAAVCAALALPAGLAAILSLFCELTGGFSSAGSVFDGGLLFAILSAAAAFSGICVHFQVISSAKAAGVGPRRFVFGKVMQGILTFFFSYLIYLQFFS